MLSKISTGISDIMTSGEEALLESQKFLEKGATTILTTVTVLGAGGIIIASVVAPVPVLIGALSLELLNAILSSQLNNIDKKYEKNKDSIIDKLKKAGPLPKNSIIKTKYLNMNIHIETGEINGSFINGNFKDRTLSDMSISELKTALKNVDKETVVVLEQYIKNRELKEKI